jgi:transcriptional regulator with XRE-family HTH domain
MNRENVGSRLRQARDAAGLTQLQAAKKMKMHRPTISEIEASRRKVTTEEVERFAQLYGVRVAWIVSGEREPVDADDKIILAARQLSRMKESDLKRLMGLLEMLRKESK